MFNQELLEVDRSYFRQSSSIYLISNQLYVEVEENFVPTSPMEFDKLYQPDN